ncbi:hypothetical protein ACT5DM_004599 [Vibrio alginolyticus]
MEINTDFEKMNFHDVSIKDVYKLTPRLSSLSVVFSSAKSTQVQMEAI